MTIPDTVSWNPEALDEIVSNDGGRPVLFTNARIVTMDPLIGTMTGADLLFVGPLLVGVGPGTITAAGDDNVIVVDCTSMTIVPAVVDTVALAGERGHRSEYVATLPPGQHHRLPGGARRTRRRRAERGSHPDDAAGAGPRPCRGRPARPVGRH
ncbi:hypothetical protein [Streptomyces sp. NPDC091215]|uniref:hypothetical protein n=1 Tax=Streptomyces sp. NPDC091215 TaxID=3155192 RepID=UPI003425864E